ncbi:hemagglutinin repeat-containing protein [Variovorax sp. PAMC26660]|uniref:two-partner secretion domain-containing protein n=1 Tax=Variovorax sp. PAMC26660 TaxID=2762322 RepID=UPI00164E97B4|nr:hemagglutinin repeat-containing protein [Variovorax sp. PAMC26660]QNK65452.1 hemagglutinin repeat-containing protein [Variovorax sp. PAMC26660]
MNRHLHRIVFNAARGMRMVVQETATSTGKGSSKATGGSKTASSVAASVLTTTALFGLLGPMPSQAQIVGAPNVPGNLRPTVLVAPNGLPLINVQTPSAAGVSRNVYNQFNVGPNGAILNNSRANVQTQLGGFVQGNPHLATGPARIILNEVNGGIPSQLRGYIEVGGQRAEVIIANPAGISVDGGGFINASRATLTTGTPQFSPSGSLDSFLVRGGTISIDGAGLDASKTDYAAILARAVQANAGIWASELKVVAGANQVSADYSQISPTTGTGPVPTFALDVAALGGMYAGKITLIGTEAGLGVRNAGTIQAAPGTPVLAGAGQLVVTSAGRLENIGAIQATADANLAASNLANGGRISSGGNLKIATQDTLANSLNGAGGTLEGARVELASVAGNIDNRNGGTIRQTSSAALAISAPVLSNTAGGVIGLEPVAATPPQSGSETSPGTGGAAITPGSPGAGSGSGSGATITPAPYVPPSPGAITAAGGILNDGGRIYAGGPISLESANIINNGGTLNLASMRVSQPTFDNRGGTVNISNGFSANVERFDNMGGELNAGSLNIASSGDLINVDGALTSATDANLTVGGKADNTRGTISAAAALTANVAGATNNSAGTLASNQGLTFNTNSLDNTKGSIQSAQAGVRLTVTSQLANGSGGAIGATSDLNVQAGTLVNGGSLRGANDVKVAVGGALTNDGSITAGRNTTITTGSLQGRNAGVLGAGVLGAGVQNDGKLGGAGDLRVTSTGALVANGINLAAGDATLQGASVDLSASQTSAANIAITATQGNVVTGSKAAVVTPGILSITANAQPGQTLVNDAGQLNAGKLDLNVSNIANTNGGEIVQTGGEALTIATSGTLNNDGGRIASNGQDLNLRGASITNANGQIEHAGAGMLTIAGGSYNGANGQITTNKALTVAMSGTFNQDGTKARTSAERVTIDAGSLSNRGGQIIQTGSDATRINVVGAADNSDGTIASNGNTNIAAGSLTNQGGIVRATGTSNLDVIVDSVLDNSKNGEIGAGANATITVKNKAGSLNNDTGSITAAGDLSATIGGAATNVGGMLAAKGNTTFSANTLDNSKGTVAAVAGNLGVTTMGVTINKEGGMKAGGAATLTNGGLVNDAGKVTGKTLVIDASDKLLSNDHGILDSAATLDIRSGALGNNAGLIQSVDAMSVNTRGQKLTNTRSPDPEKKQGEIISGGALTLRTGAVDNTAGYIGSKGLLDAETGKFTNASGGTVLGQSTVAINTKDASYDNSGGQTQAVGDLTINAGDIQNSGGLVRSLAKTTLNAASIGNANTRSANQGIEGKNVSIGVGGLNNNTGAVRADQNVTIVSSGPLDNSKGLISAIQTLAIKDPNAGNPGAKTLVITNTDGTLVGGTAAVRGPDGKVQTPGFGGVVLDAKSFSNDGQLVSANDLGVALVGDITNNAEVAANGNLSYATTGTLTNNGKLLAGQKLTIGGSDINNTASAEMSGADTVVNASGTLINRGLIDSKGATQVNAGAVKNIGTGRIYGNQLSIGTGTLDNDAETANGVTKAGTIAARNTLNIGANTINNREHALIFSGGTTADAMRIGARLDADRLATGQGSVLNNLSADIESLGSMVISMDNVNNRDIHIERGEPVVKTSVAVTYAPYIPQPGRGGFYTLDQVRLDPINRTMFLRKPDGSEELIGTGGYGQWTAPLIAISDTAKNLDPARMAAAGDIAVSGRFYNENSQVTAGGTATGGPYVPEQMKGQVTLAVGTATVISDQGELAAPVAGSTKFDTISLGAYKYEPNLNAVNGKALGPASSVNVGTHAGGVGGVGAGSGPATIVEVPAQVGAVVSVGGQSAGSTDGVATTAQAGSARTIPMVVRTSAPNIAVPRASLFNVRSEAGSHYLIETDPRFANYRNWLSSDYLLNNLGQDPNNILKRLGDGFYEQKLIREQVAQLTGYRFLDGFANDDDQYAALMNAGATFAKQYGLRPGIGLSAAQMAQLTSDIVWLVERSVTLPDGSTQQALVPQVYVRVRPGDIDGSGALLSADATVIKTSGDLVNTGTIAGRTLVSINAENVNNLGGRIAGGSIGINARNDLNNIGGSITARDAAMLTAGRDINIQTTTQTGVSRTDIDRVAGVYVTDPGGVLIASAGRDTNLIAAALVSAGSVAVGAGRNINLGTVTENRSSVVAGKGIAAVAFESREVGSVIQGQDNVRLAAGSDLNIRAGAIASVDGALIATARNDINVTAGQSTSSIATSTQSSSKSLFKKSSSSTFDSTSTTDVLSSSLSGKSMALVAGNDVNLKAAQLRTAEAMSLSAGRDINLTTANRTTQEAHAKQSRSSATGLGNAIGMSMGPDTPNGAAMRGSKSATSANGSSRTDAIGTSVSAGSLQTVSGRDTTLQAATVVADNNITMLAGRNLTIESAQNTRTESSYDANSKSGMVGKWYNPAIGNIKGSQATATTSTTQQASQVASLQGNVTLVAGNEYRQTASSVLAAGQAGPLVGGDVNILAKNVVINEAYNTSMSVTMDKSSSSILGGSASVMGISTDTLKGASSTIKAMGDTSDSRSQALGALNLAMSGKQVYDTASKLANGGGMSYGVSVNVSRNTSQSTSITSSSEAVGSGVVGANNVNIAATGDGKDSNIHAIGSTIAAGNTANLAADNDVTLEASKNTSKTVGQNSSRGANVGVTFGAGAQTGFSIQLGVSKGKGRDNQDNISYNATQVSGGKAVNISSGGDLNMRGGIVEANRVTADVGGNLNIESLQDVSVGQSRQSSGGFNVSLCIPPICYGISTAGGNAAGAKADGVFVSPAVQSGIKAGDGGFDVKVAGNTDLKGAVIESTQAAIDNKKNSFSTGGELTMSDLQNVSQSSGSSFSVSGSVGFFAGDEAAHRQVLRERGMTDADIDAMRRPGGGAGVGSHSGNNQTSVTKSGISGVAGDQNVRTGDNSSAGTLVKDWNTKTIIKDVQAQAQISQEFKQKAAKAIGDFADGKLNDAKKLRGEAEAELDLDKKAALIAQARDLETNWKEGGAYRVLAHAASGGLSGGVAGALGAGASSALMPRIGEAIAGMGLPSPVAQAVGAATAAAIGGMVGGAAGASGAYSIDINNRQLRFTEAQKLAALQANKTQQEKDRLQAAACFLVKCADGISKDDKAYGKLRSLQDDGKKYEAEQAALRATGEFVYEPYVDAARDALTRNGELIRRTGGAANLAGGSVGLVGGGALAAGGALSCLETFGLGCLAVPLGTGIAVSANAQAQDGSKTLFGPYQSSEGQRVLDSFNVAGYPGERDPLMDVGIDASKFGLAWLGGKYIPKALAKAEGMAPMPVGVPRTASGTCSFRGDMLVKTTSGYTQIKDIRVGDGVFSRDEREGVVGYKTVLAQYSNPYQETVYVTIKDADGRVQVIVSNAVHPFFAKLPGIESETILPKASEGHNYQGPILHAQWVDAANLKTGYRLLGSSGNWLEVKRIQRTSEPLRAYNLTVADFHTYFVKGEEGAEGVWVHNNCWSNLPGDAIATGKTTPDGRPLYTFKGEDGRQVTAYQGKAGDAKWYDPKVYAPDLPIPRGVNVKAPPEPVVTSPLVLSTSEQAAMLGYRKTNENSKFGEPVYFNPRAKKEMQYISRDVGSGNGVGSHNGGFWKAASSVANLGKNTTRTGTFDVTLDEKIGK